MSKFILHFLVFHILMVWQAMALATTGIYLTIDSGWVNSEGLPNEVKANATGIHTNNFPGLRIGAGYLHDFNSSFGIGFETAKGFYAKTTYYLNDGKEIEVKTTAVDFLFVAASHFKKIDLFVKIGGNRNTTAIKKPVGNVEQCRIQPVAGFGINYNFSSHLAVAITYMHSFGQAINDFSDKSWKCPSINAVLGGLKITFG